MECYNCGAYYDSNERMCPFYHCENPEYAVKEKQKMIEAIQKEREEILQIPRKG